MLSILVSLVSYWWLNAFCTRGCEKFWQRKTCMHPIGLLMHFIFIKAIIGAIH